MKTSITPNTYKFKLEITKNNHGVSSFGGIPLLLKTNLDRKYIIGID